jgi:NlpC/P60 family putative phage cell wall peptidase
MTPGERAVEAARRWIGTPYVHQASCPGAGADCLGLIRGVWRQLYGAEPCAVPAYTADWAEATQDERLLRAAALWLRPKSRDAAATGDVLLFRMRDGGIAKHLGIQSACGAEARFIHAFSGHAVTESALSAPWARRIAARFAFPEGTN